jgi:orotidine-5'-phosphate decarboxylase
MTALYIMNPLDKYAARVDQSNSLLCVGLDTDIRYLPRQFRDDPFPQFAFNHWIIEQTHHYVCAFKPNMAFYEACGDRGVAELKMTLDYLRERHPDIFTICDAKRADVGTINARYVESIFDWMGFDAVTLQPYPGKVALQPFLERIDKCSIILCRTSSPGLHDLQDLQIGSQPLWEVVAERVYQDWNVHNNCMLVVGANFPSELKRARDLVGDMTLLVPGVGIQGSSIRHVVEAGLNSAHRGVIVNSSRSVIFADDPAGVARRLRDEINQWRSDEQP